MLYIRNDLYFGMDIHKLFLFMYRRQKILWIFYIMTTIFKEIIIYRLITICKELIRDRHALIVMLYRLHWIRYIGYFT